MKPKSLLLLALALGCGLVASIGISQVMDQNGRGPTMETAPIYVALHNIKVGDPIDGGMVSLQEWPKDKIPPGAITQLENLEGRRPRTNIIAGETILDGKLLAPGEFADPLTHITPGMRLVTISVDAEKSAAGLLSPGDRVDVQWYVNRDERNGIMSATTKILLQDVRVFAIEQAVQRAADGGEARNIPKTVSLEVSTEQAAKIALAEAHGELSLIPRSPTDNATAAAEVTLDDIMSDGSDKNSREEEQGVTAERPAEQKEGNGFFGDIFAMMRQAAEDRPPFEMEIIRAGERSTMAFDPTTGKPLRPVDDDEESFVSRRAVDTAGAASADDSDVGELEDFPIDFGGE
ncbi:MAG: Flp pilus assembly protein CpaB [Planctomycetota bacterium]